MFRQASQPPFIDTRLDVLLAGSLPVNLGRATTLAALNVLDLSGNKFKGGLPREWANAGYFKNLFNLNLANNPLTGAAGCRLPLPRSAHAQLLLSTAAAIAVWNSRI
jgi:hypothetical protein